MAPPRDVEGRERMARGLGIAVACAAMATAWYVVGWPAPGVSAALGLLVWGIARRA